MRVYIYIYICMYILSEFYRFSFRLLQWHDADANQDNHFEVGARGFGFKNRVGVGHLGPCWLQVTSLHSCYKTTQ